MAIKKSELYSSLWKGCDELRGGMDASQYKDYVLVLLFVKYVSDKYAGQKDALLDVPEGGSFADMVALKGDKEIGDKLNKIIGKNIEPKLLPLRAGDVFRTLADIRKIKKILSMYKEVLCYLQFDPQCSSASGISFLIRGAMTTAKKR
jgi:type I restriction-modification system DNA methylase subunit